MDAEQTTSQLQPPSEETSTTSSTTETTSLDDIPIPQELGALGVEISDAEESLSVRTKRDELAATLKDKPPASAMLSSFGFIFRWLSTMLFAHVLFEKRCVDNIRDASERGTIVYVMQSHSLFDYLYFNYALLREGLPLAQFANGLSMTPFRNLFASIAAIFRRANAAPPEAQVEALVANNRPVFLFLEKRRLNDEENLEFSQKYLYRLVRNQRRRDEPIYLLPMLLFWERRPDPKYVSFLGDIFGTNQQPGFFRKIAGFITTSWQSFFNIAQPIVQVSSAINLQNFLREYPNAGSADACELIRQRVLEHFEQERLVMLGPTGQTPEQTYNTMLQRPELTSTIRELALRDRVPEEQLRKRVRKYFDEIAAAQSLLVIKIFSALLGLIWYRIYDGFEVDEAGLERVREAGKSSSLVLIPSHKSHVDYLILSYLFYHYGLVPPHIAAGVNLSFFPMGPIFRRSGAFFIRRSFKGEELYPIVFREYLIQLMSQGYPIEFFIEGTRSRTGKLIKPRYGMLEMILSAYTSGRVDEISIVPISVGYEKIIEAASYKKEILGAEKKKESLAGLLKTPKFLASRYGRLNVQFGEPITLSAYLKKYDVKRINPDDEHINSLLVRLAHRIIYDINQATAVTPTALAAMILLNNTARNIDRARLLHEAGFILRFAHNYLSQVRLSTALEHAMNDVISARDPNTEANIGEAIASVIDEAIDLFKANAYIKIIEESTEDIFYTVPEDKRLELSFYRNTIIHLVVPEALLSMAILRFGLKQITRQQAHDETLFLSRLFKYEWIYEERAEFENVFQRSLDRFAHAGWVELLHEDQEDETHIEVTGDRQTELHFLRRIALTFLEAYAIVSSFFEQLHEEEIERNDWLDAALKRGRTKFLKGDILFYESLSKPTMLNAIRVFVDWGVLTERREPGRKKDSINYTIAPSWREGQAIELHQHLTQLVYLGNSIDKPMLTSNQN